MSWLTVTTLTGFAVSVLSIARADSGVGSLRNLNAALAQTGVNSVEDTSASLLGVEPPAASAGSCASTWEAWSQGDTEWRTIARGPPLLPRDVEAKRPNCFVAPSAVAPSNVDAQSGLGAGPTPSLALPIPSIEATPTAVQSSTTQFVHPPPPEVTTSNGFRLPAGLPHHAETYARPNPATSAFDDFDDDPLPPQIDLPPLPTPSPSVRRAAETTMQPLPSTWFADNRGLDVILNLHGQPVIATYMTGATPQLVLPTPNAGNGGDSSPNSANLAHPGAAATPLTISAGGPAVTYNGEVISLEAQGVVIGTQTISIAAVAPVIPTDSAATVTVDGRPMTFLKHAGNPAVMTYNSVTISIGGTALVTEGHTISMNTRGELIVDESQTVDATPLAMVSSGAPLPNPAAATGAGGVGPGPAGSKPTGLLTAQGGISSFSAASPKKTAATKGGAEHINGQSGGWIALIAAFASFLVLTNLL